MPNLFAKRLKSAGGFNPMDNTTISNSSSFTPSSGVEYLTVTFLRFRDLFSYRCIASYESHPGKILRSLVVSLKILPIGTNIVMEYRALGIRVMIFCQNHLFLGIGAAYGRTIAVAARKNLSRTDALNPGYFMGMLHVGGAQYLALVGPRWRHNSRS